MNTILPTLSDSELEAEVGRAVISKISVTPCMMNSVLAEVYIIPLVRKISGGDLDDTCSPGSRESHMRVSRKIWS